jgi:hypothetical protein
VSVKAAMGGRPAAARISASCGSMPSLTDQLRKKLSKLLVTLRTTLRSEACSEALSPGSDWRIARSSSSSAGERQDLGECEGGEGQCEGRGRGAGQGIQSGGDELGLCEHAHSVR